MKNKSKLKSVLSALLTMCMLISAAPVTTFAAQSNEYVDPADSWLSSNNRTNELDVNATTTVSYTHLDVYKRQLHFISGNV